MISWTYNFWQMLAMLFAAYYIGGIVADVKTVMAAKAAAINIISIDIEKVEDVWYAFEEKTKRFIVQAPTYEALQTRLNNLNDGNTYVTDVNALNKLLGESENAPTIL